MDGARSLSEGTQCVRIELMVDGFPILKQSIMTSVEFSVSMASISDKLAYSLMINSTFFSAIVEVLKFDSE